MGRLHAIHLHTPDLARQREFYVGRLALDVAGEDPARVQLATRGARLDLVAGAEARVEYVLALRDVQGRRATLTARGAQVQAPPEAAPPGTVATLRDPDDVVLHLVEDAGEPDGRWPHLSHLVINAADQSRSVHFYRDLLGLRIAADHGPWIEFETGSCRLLVHDRTDAAGLALVSEQRVTFALSDADLDAWAEQLRAAGMVFATAPMDEELGRVAEVEDADGWFVMLRGPGTELGAEEDLAADFESDDEDDDHGGLRRAIDPTERAQRPGFGSRKLTRRKPERVQTRGFDAAAPPSREAPRPSGFTPRPFVPRPDGSGPPRPGGPRPMGAGPPRGAGPPGPMPPRPFEPRGERPPARPFTPGPSTPHPMNRGPRRDGPGPGPMRRPGSGPPRPRDE